MSSQGNISFIGSTSLQQSCLRALYDNFIKLPIDVRLSMLDISKYKKPLIEVFKKEIERVEQLKTLNDEKIKAFRWMRIYSYFLNEQELVEKIDKILKKQLEQTIDFNPKIARMAKTNWNYYRLYHMTKLKNLTSIIHCGEIVDRGGETTCGGTLRSTPKNYFSILPKNSSVYSNKHQFQRLFCDLFNDEKVMLIFSLKLLSRDDYHISREWEYGKKSKGFIAPDQLLEETNSCRLDSNFENEVVIENSVSISDLKEIWVQSKDEEKVKDELSKLPDALKWQKLVKAMDDFPDILQSQI